MASEVEIFSRPSALTKLPPAARNQNLPTVYRELYNSLLTQALDEFPLIEGYETMHAMLMERLVLFFCMMKQDEAKVIQSYDLKLYKLNFTAFIKTCEALLKEARSISAEASFKHNFIRQVVEVIDRIISDRDTKRQLIKELHKLGTQ